jgi:formamidopyrimidine-DNA glycosylase
MQNTKYEMQTTMPELPEVETIRQQLIKKIKDKKIKKVEVKLPRMINVAVSQFEKVVSGAKISNIRRRAKLLIVDLLNGWSIIIHLKLTGQLIYNGKEGIGKPHIVCTFSDGHELKYYDFRLFGWAKLVKTSEVEKFLEKEKFGPEPLDKNFTLEVFKNLLNKKPRAKIKPLLMDQTFIAGVGNVYAQEACFYAKVLPTRQVGTLTLREIKDLYEGLIKILKKSIGHKGSSIDTYVDVSGERGGYVPFLKVYGRAGEKCTRGDGGIIKQIKLAGRGTCFCPKCQR